MGRKTRRAEGAANQLELFRAGFEPRRGCATSPIRTRRENDRIMDDGTRTHGSKPARTNRKTSHVLGAPSFSPHRAPPSS